MGNAAPISLWTSDPPSSMVRQALDSLARARDVVHIAVMPDVHPGAGICNGVVVATRDLVYPAAVGGDIGCGFATVMLGISAAKITRRSHAEAVLADFPGAVPVMRHRRRDGLPELAGALDPAHMSSEILAAQARNVGRLELATLGRGNHFLEFQRDGEERLWLMVHSGSRAMGQQITAFHRKQAVAAGSGLASLDVNTASGRAYLRDVEWARAYARASRRLMLESAASVVEQLLGCSPDWATYLNTDHNHVQQEAHDCGTVWVHRKGANTAEPDAPNLIPGSMATHTYHVTGRGSADALRSSSHGAGRRLSRGAARARIKRKDLERELARVWVDPKIASRLTDEAPSAYKDLDVVMRAQPDLVRIERRVEPVLCYKGV